MGNRNSILILRFVPVPVLTFQSCPATPVPLPTRCGEWGLLHSDAQGGIGAHGLGEQWLCELEDGWTILMAEMAAEIVAVWVSMCSLCYFSLVTKLVSCTFSGLLDEWMVGEELG